ncbi:hypothetical protein [Thermococcus sp.]
MDDRHALINYYAFTIPHITVLAGALLGILLIVGINPKIALSIFSIVYGSLLIIIGLIVRPQFSKLTLYKISIIFFLGILLAGIVLFSLSLAIGSS